MIYVLDNGCCYSDHAIHFIDVPDDVDAALRKDVIAFMEVPSYETPQVIAIAKQFEWLHPGGQSFAEWFKWEYKKRKRDVFYAEEDQQFKQSFEQAKELRAKMDALGHFE